MFQTKKYALAIIFLLLTSMIFTACGGAQNLPSFYTLKEAFDHKNIPAWFAEWGHDVSHDWVWWRKQMPYFLNELNL